MLIAGAALAALAVPFGSATGASAEPADRRTHSTQADLSCGRLCDEKDPATYRVRIPNTQEWYTCDQGARTVRTRDVNEPAFQGQLQLRYSPYCRTTWVRWQGDRFATAWVVHQSYYLDGTQRKTTGKRSTHGPWTLMLDDRNLQNRGCVRLFRNEWDTSPYKTLCTGYY